MVFGIGDAFQCLVIDHEQQQAEHRNLQNQNGARQREPALVHPGVDQRVHDADGDHPDAGKHTAQACPASSPALQVALGFHHQPGAAYIAIGGHHAASAEYRERFIQWAAVETDHIVPEHVALHERRQAGAELEQVVPQAFSRGIYLGAEIEGYAAQDQPGQHQGGGQVQFAQNEIVGGGESDQQQAHRQYQPGLVGIPERADGCNHGIALTGGIRPLTGGQEYAHAQVIAVEQGVHQNRQGHQSGERHHQCLGFRHTVLPLKCALAESPGLSWDSYSSTSTDCLAMRNNTCT